MENQENQPQTNHDGSNPENGQNQGGDTNQTSSTDNVQVVNEQSTTQPEAGQNEKMDFDNYAPNIAGNSGNKEDAPKGDEDEGKKSKVGTVITAILIVVVAYGIWSANRDVTPEVAGDSNDNSEISIVVDDTKQTGEVTIVDEVEKENDSRNLGETIKITAYYSKSADDCEKVLPLEREVEKKYDSNVINTIRGLLTVLTAEETKQDWTTSIPVGTYLKYVSIKNGVAEVSLTSALGTTAGSCAVTAVRAQIEKTLLQFPYIDLVNICIEGNCNQDTVLQP